MRKNTKRIFLFLILFLIFAFVSTFTSKQTFAFAAVSRPDPEKIKRAQSLAADNKTDEAVKLLNDLIAQETGKEKRALIRMALGVLLFRAARDSEAEVQFRAAIEDGTRIDDYASYYLGLLYKKTGRLKDAERAFDRLMDSRTPVPTQTDARFHVGEILIAAKDWKAAAVHFESLRKRLKNTEYYPDALYHLLRAERRIGHKAQSCKWARELYSRFPAHPLIRDWGVQLGQNVVDGEKLGCRVPAKELRTRARRLQLAGEADRAVAELKELGGGEGEDEGGTYAAESMLASHMISEGRVEEAMKLLLKHYKAQASRPAYLQLLAKAASRAGDYQAAVGAYMRAFEIAPRARNASNALFQAAFTSYQFQDYDGATRKFEQFVKTFPGSKLARDSHWHLAWMRYLRGDYMGAYQSFLKLSVVPSAKRRGRRAKSGSDAISAVRIRYWMAMSLLKVGRTHDAVTLLQQLVRDPAIDYYSVVAYYRLTAIPGAKLPTGIESRLGLKKSSDGAAPTEEELQAASEALQEARAEFESEEKTLTEVTDTAEAAEAGEQSEGGDEETATDEGVAAATDEKIATFMDDTIARRFERARDLSFIDLEDAARRELGEIERRARSLSDRRLLMTEYQQVRNYYRSSYMGEIGFGPQRLRGGLRGESRPYWEFAYPRAFEPAVLESSKASNVPEQLIWGIMRAESHYKHDIASPVGALGLMQVMPFTGRQVANLLNMSGFETRSLLEPETNIRLGTRYLQRLLEKFSGSIPLVAAGYNAGPHRVHAWVRNFGTLDMDEFIEHIPFVETRNYVKRVVRNYQIYSLLYSGGTHSLRWLVKPVGIELSEEVPTKEVW